MAIAAIRARSLRRLRWGLFGLAFSALACLAQLHLPAQTSMPSQLEVQSVYLFDFTKFVRWAPEPSQPSLRMCVAGENAYVTSLKKVVSGEKVDGKPLDVTQVKDPAELNGCSVLFIDGAEKSRMDSLLAAASGQPLLTVSDAPDFLSRGGMIQFVNVAKRVRFAVNLQAVQHSGLVLSSELLKVAVSVTGNPGGAR